MTKKLFLLLLALLPMIGYSQDDKIYDSTEEWPSYPGKTPEVVNNLIIRAKYPNSERATLSGHVTVNFVIEKDGSLSNIKVIKNLSPALDAEALRIVRSMQKWNPGRNQGKPVRCYYNIGVTFDYKNNPSLVQQYSEKILSITANGVSFKMILVNPGTFIMGYTDPNKPIENELPTHKVTLPYYYIGEAEVTQALWQAVMGSNPSPTKYKGLQKPVIGVSWNDCQEFIRKLNKITGRKFRLPTEAEWEFAAREGEEGEWHWKYSGTNEGRDINGNDMPPRFAWYREKDQLINDVEPHNVKTKNPNGLKLYDMSGNVAEWCQDWYGNYSSSAQTNPTGPESGYGRVIRGGSWKDELRKCRVTARDKLSPSACVDYVGLRLAL